MPCQLVNSYDFQRSMPPPSTGSCNPLGNPAECQTPWIEPAGSCETSVTVYQSTWHNISETLKLKKRLTYYSNTDLLTSMPVLHIQLQRL